jgi:class 3 adenylate cyclase/tetratricopeptide (TPR) repeat protein
VAATFSEPTPIDAKRSPVTLMFTDMVGSSAAKRAQALGPDASARDRAYLDNIQSKHLRLIRNAVAEHNGKEIMTIGDSFFLTFKEPLDAMRCAAAIQQRLREQPIDTPTGPLRLRIGIHIGTPEFFENSWHGTDVDTAARAESAGSPGQIVVTDAVRQALGDPMGIRFRQLGTFRLKGVGNVKLWDADYDNHGLRHPSIPSNAQRQRQTLLYVSVASAVLLVGLLLGGMFMRNRPTPHAAAPSTRLGVRDSIILADFENKTGEPVFDTTLTQALAIQLQQSPVLNLVSQQHLRQSMKYLGRSQNDLLTPALAREIGQREGVKAYLTGTIAKLGTTYVITVTAQNTNTGDDIASEVAQAPDKEHVLEALDRVATNMRSRLGETLYSIEKLDTPLGQATTPSLDAFRAYALGDVEHEKGLDVPQAEGHYRQALEMDPNFAMAWARLGVVSINTGKRGKAIAYFTKAFQLSKNVSERERLYIEGHYYNAVLGDLQKTIDTLELATRTYPLNFDNYVNLGVAQLAYGRIQESLDSTLSAAKISPDDAVAQGNILQSLLDLDRLDEAEKTAATMRQLGIDQGTGEYLVSEYQLKFLKGEPAEMQKMTAQAEGRPDEFIVTISAAQIAEFAGRYREADRTWRRAAQQGAAQKAPDVEANSLLLDISGRGLAGMCQDEPEMMRRALAADHSKPTLAQAAFAASLCSDTRTATPLLASLARSYPTDTLIKQVTVPQSNAALALASHKPQQALTYLENSRSFDQVTPSAYLRGLAYLDLHDADHAVESFRIAMRYRGAALQFSQDYGQAQLGLARAYAMKGDREAAKKAYADLFVTWKDADPDLPQWMAAKKEAAAL